MHIKFPYQYTEQSIPKYCHKPRPVIFDGNMSLLFHEITGEEAPVAIRQHTLSLKEDAMEDERVVLEYRWWRQRLWRIHRFNRFSHGPYEIQTSEQFAQDPWPLTNDSTYSCYRSHQQRRQDLTAWARSILFIDGKRWHWVNEPRYVIMTFGLGHNHGHPGTALSTDNHYNPNIAASRYYRIDRQDEALASALEIAQRRGDDKAFPFIKDHRDTFDILIPEAIRLNPQKEHGPGDSFTNKLEGMIESSPSKEIAGLMVIKEAISIISKS
ncbi:hypothetical protein LCGC14_0262460 [marine sediment metagenome]|uniref:Uncharacterized protein n=1 Tax=marine sediment metagenome TaxID=412755 RepID=A0A0F9UHY3_9ZZZZ